MAQKEIQFFGSDLPNKGLSEDQYLAYFRGAGSAQRVGEASVRYLASRTAASQIHAFSPDAEIIVMLRHPVATIAAMHADLLAAGVETIADLSAALEAETRRRAELNCVHPLLYREQVAWATHLQRYLDTFGKGQVHVVIFEDLRDQTAEAYDGVLQFLGLETFLGVEFDIHNRRKEIRSRSFQQLFARRPRALSHALRRVVPEPALRSMYRAIMTLNTREVARPRIPAPLAVGLTNEFAPEVRSLERMLHRDLSVWLDAPSEHS
jgi:hypothetical protein